MPSLSGQMRRYTKRRTFSTRNLVGLSVITQCCNQNKTSFICLAHSPELSGVWRTTLGFSQFLWVLRLYSTLLSTRCLSLVSSPFKIATVQYCMLTQTEPARCWRKVFLQTCPEHTLPQQNMAMSLFLPSVIVHTDDARKKRRPTANSILPRQKRKPEYSLPNVTVIEPFWFSPSFAIASSFDFDNIFQELYTRATIPFRKTYSFPATTDSAQYVLVETLFGSRTIFLTSTSLFVSD